MAFFYGIVALVTLFVILNLFTELDKRDKIVIASVVGILIASAIWFEKNNNAQRAKTHSLLLKFKQGQTLICGDVNVTKENFNYVSHTFIGLDKTDFKGFIIAEKLCK